MKNSILWVTLAFIWGSSFLAIKIGIESISALSLVSIRMLIGTLCLLAVLAYQKQKLPKELKLWTVLLVAGLTGNIIPFTLISYGESHVNSGLASLIMGIAPVVTILIAPAFIKEEVLTGRAILGVFIALLGLLTLVGPLVLNGIGAHVYGQTAIICAALCYAFTTVFVKKYSKMPAIVMASGSMLIGTLVIITATLVLENPYDDFDSSLDSLISAIYLGIFPTAIATWIYFNLLPQIGASKMSQINFVVPVVGSLLGIWVLDETFGVNVIVSMVLILLAIYLVTKKHKT